MPLSNLSIFSKNTDAVEALKGYEFQKLRTFEKWLTNKVNQIDEVIYCEYGDDVFERNLTGFVSRFTQFKLYSSKPFSFRSEEITKALANFFMLYVKGELSFDQVEFTFETNVGIARPYRDNAADLLQEWNLNQGLTDTGLLQRCAGKVKEVIEGYINSEFPKLLNERKSEAQHALVILNNLPDSVWEDFARSIKWHFSSEPADIVLEKTVSNINKLIAQLPFPVAELKSDRVFTSLYYEVSERMFQNEPENRLLNNQRIDELMLDLGDDADNRYNLVFSVWQNVSSITLFNLAEFLEVLHASNYCRNTTYLVEHAVFWQRILRLYIAYDAMPERYKRQAIYELLWLSVKNKWLDMPDGDLIGLNPLIEEYFSNISKYDDHEDVEDALVLVRVVASCIIMGKSDYDLEKCKEYIKVLGEIIRTKINEINNFSEKCYWLEIECGFINYPLQFTPLEDIKPADFSNYDAILKLLPESPLYNVTRLNDRINQFIEIFIKLGGHNRDIDKLEAIADQLMPFVVERNGKHQTAKTYVDRGHKYLHTTNPRYFAKALEYFHKAKDSWEQEETAGGFVLALVNISQMYLGLGLDMAAKYYGLGGAWFCINHNPEKYARRIADAFGLTVTADFRQGAWVSALESFKYYVRSRMEFDNRPLDGDELFAKTMIEIAGIISMAPKITNQLYGFIEYQKQMMGAVYTDFVKPLYEEYESYLASKNMEEHLQDKLDASPINDIGERRLIEWKAFGSIWKVSFPNTWLYNSIGEEFTAVLQILLVELSNLEIDLHFIRATIEIELEIVETASFEQPKQLPSNESFKWKFYSKRVDSPEGQAVQMQMAFLITGMKYLLRDVSMLSDEKFFEIVNNLFKHDGLAKKTMIVNLYQRIYRNIFSEAVFEASHRSKFAKESLSLNLEEDPILLWNNSLSSYYSKEKSLEYIKGRYENSHKVTHLTLQSLKSQEGHDDWLNGLHRQGWLDWQITLAMYNHICNYKTARIIGTQKYPSEELTRKAYDKAFHEVRKQDESTNYVRFPLDFFKGAEFEFQLKHTLWLVLHTWGLENRASFPNFPAMLDFLNHRFNFNIDDLPDLSPLANKNEHLI